METDRDAVAAMFDVLRLEDRSRARVARIRNTLEVEHIQISETLAQEFGDHPDLTLEGDLQPMAFDGNGTLL